MTKKILKKNAIIVTITASIIALTACANPFASGGNTGKTATVDDLHKLFDTAEFSVVIPKDWEIIQEPDFTNEVPVETHVVFRNNVKNETFTANVVIVKNFLQTSVPSLEYAKMVINRQKLGLFGYKENSKDSYKIKIGGKEEETYFTRFEAKKSSDEKLIKYSQTYAVKGNNAYIVLGSVSPQENQNTVKTIEDIVKSFAIK